MQNPEGVKRTRHTLGPCAEINKHDAKKGGREEEWGEEEEEGGYVVFSQPIYTLYNVGGSIAAEITIEG